MQKTIHNNPCHNLHGVWWCRHAGGGRNGKCLRQVVTAKPVLWNRDADPSTIVGDNQWTDYCVSVDALLEQPGYVELVGRQASSVYQNYVAGYHLRLDDKGHWSLRLISNPKTKQKGEQLEKELASGDLPSAAGVGRWHRLSLDFRGNQIQPAIDGKNLCQPVEDTEFHSGLVGLVTSRWTTSEFMNLEVVK